MLRQMPKQRVTDNNMKITKGKLQQIIREEFSHVLNEHAEEKYVVRVTSSSPHAGARTSYWPSNDRPFVGSLEAANLEVDKATEGPVPGKRSRFARPWKAIALDLDGMSPDDPMRAPLAAAAENAQSFGTLHPDDEPMNPNFRAFKGLEDDDE